MAQMTRQQAAEAIDTLTREPTSYLAIEWLHIMGEAGLAAAVHGVALEQAGIEGVRSFLLRHYSRPEDDGSLEAMNEAADERTDSLLAANKAERMEAQSRWGRVFADVADVVDRLKVEYPTAMSVDLGRSS